MRDPEFLKYWTSQAIYGFGFPIAQLAIPLLAVSVLQAGAVEMGLLGAAGTAAFLVLGLPAGVIVDRTRRRPLMVGLDLTGAAVLALVPLSAAIGALRLEILYLVQFLFGCVGVIATVAYQAFLPTLVGRSRLVEANSRVQLTASTALAAGPAIGGVLIQLVTAPFAIVATVVSHVISSTLLLTIRVQEPAPRARGGRSIVADLREGLDLVFADQNIRSIMLCGTVHNIFSNGMLVALYVLFATRELGVTPAQLGIVFAAAGPGAILGSLLATSLPRAVGLGPAIGAMQVFTGVARLAMPVAALAAAVPPFLVLALGELVLAVARTIFNVNQLSLRQAITPDHQQGRMNASIRFVMWAVVPFGALLGGWLGDRIGLMPTIWIGVAGTFLASLWIFLTPVRSLREAPEAVPA
jgi:MFS family permease